MENKITHIEALPDLHIKARFANGDIRIYDVAPMQKEFPCFSALLSVRGLFEDVHIDAGGYGIMWNDELDIASEEIWTNGEPVTEGTENDCI